MVNPTPHTPQNDHLPPISRTPPPNDSISHTFLLPLGICHRFFPHRGENPSSARHDDNECDERYYHSEYLLSSSTTLSNRLALSSPHSNLHFHRSR
mmetsp:Transcript_29671/g.61613  ORF Transcript_29671/g.61613 Transcript_29671/m.61613 type:complete len:96 (-) Transcript_29671:1370-1657(-)